MVGIKFSLLLFFFSISAQSAENCFLRSYVESNSAPFREVSFSVPPTGMTVSRILPTASMNPRLRELFDFMKSNSIPIVPIRGPVPPLAGEGTIYISVGSDALVSEAAMTEQLKNSLRSFFDAPVNYERLPAQSLHLVQRMRENFQTRFINEASGGGVSYGQRNMIGINARHTENLRVNSAVSHEITHNTTDRKIFEAFNPTPGRLAQPLTPRLAGRGISFRPKSGKSLELPSSLKAYEGFMSSDEVEAMLREMAQAKKDGLSNATAVIHINQFLDAQERNIRLLLRNNQRDLQVTTGEIIEELGAGRRQQRVVWASDSDFTVEMLVPRNLTGPEEKVFIGQALEDRLATFEQYRKSIHERFPAE